MIPIQVNMNQAAIMAHSRPWNVPQYDPERLCSNDSCDQLGTSFCSKCRHHKYCSRSCQRIEWKNHKAACVPFSPEPVHEAFTDDEGKKKRRLESIDVKRCRAQDESEIMVEIGRRLQTLYAEHHTRVGYFGASRFAKTLIMLKDQEEHEYYVGSLKDNLRREFYSHTIEEWDEWLTSIDSDTSAEQRKQILADWEKADSTARILTTSSVMDLELIVPDVETLIVIAEDEPEMLDQRWQRMARMCGQMGSVFADILLSGGVVLGQDLVVVKVFWWW
jgi:hypothetical protein